MGEDLRRPARAKAAINARIASIKKESKKTKADFEKGFKEVVSD